MIRIIPPEYIDELIRNLNREAAGLSAKIIMMKRLYASGIQRTAGTYFAQCLVTSSSMFQPLELPLIAEHYHAIINVQIALKMYIAATSRRELSAVDIENAHAHLHQKMTELNTFHAKMEVFCQAEIQRKIDRETYINALIIKEIESATMLNTPDSPTEGDSPNTPTEMDSPTGTDTPTEDGGPPIIVDFADSTATQSQTPLGYSGDTDDILDCFK